MAGIFGFYAFGEGRESWDAARFIYYGLSALQGRGEEAASTATYNSKTRSFKLVKARGLVDELFKDREEGGGFLGIGMVSSTPKDFLVQVKGPVELVLAGDGKPALGEDRGAAFQALAKMLSESLIGSKRPLEASYNLIREVRGGYSFVALTAREELICGRDGLGIKPLEVGSVGFDLGMVASESAALDVVGASHSGYVKPGEAVLFDPLSITRKSMDASRSAHCAFEYVYLARPDSHLNDVPVHRAREDIGRRLAEESPAKGDVVIGVPDTALPVATAYSEATGIPVKMGFSRTGRYTRSAIKPTQIERLVGVQLKLNPIRHSVDDRDVILIDDSVVRGNTLKNTVLNLKRGGAKKVHVRVGSPALVSHCPFGTEIPTQDELIGRALPQEEIAEIVGADSFSYLTIDGLVRAIGLPKDRICLGCFTGDYPKEAL